MKKPGLLCTPSEITSQHSAPVSLQPGANTSPIVPCSSSDFRIIARPVKSNSSKKPQNQFYAQAQYTTCNPNYTQHYGNFQGMQGLQTPNLLPNGPGGMNTSHSSMQRNNLQENPLVQSYMTPIQSTSFQFDQIGRQRNSQAYNAFTAYGNPFGIFWSRQN